MKRKREKGKEEVDKEEKGEEVSNTVLLHQPVMKLKPSRQKSS